MDATDRPTVISLMGPTAAGKTAAAIALSEVLPVDIISVDSSQIYRGMNIGTAKPTAEELARAPHRLIDIRDPAQAYSAAEFCEDARREIDDILRRGRLPLLVGGTMFYFHALEYGLSALPSADSEVRERLREEAAVQGWPALHARLAAIDPETASRIAPQDTQRIQRALEIYALTGQAPSKLGQERPPQPSPYRFVKLALMPQDRAALHARIATRFERMLALGLIDEVRQLYERGDLYADLPSIRTVGYRQTWEYLRAEINYNQLIDKATAATRQLAKRQITWLRSYEGLQCWDIWNPAFCEQMTGFLRRECAIQR